MIRRLLAALPRPGRARPARERSRSDGEPTLLRPPYPDLQPTVEWQLCGACNYDCSYCIQSRRSRRGKPSAQTLGRILTGLAGLPGSWEIKLSGGEPFVHPGLLRQVVPALVERSAHAISVLTNLSAPQEELARFCSLAGERLRVVSASLHLEHVSLEEFCSRACRLRELLGRHNPRASLVVNGVLVPGRLHRQREVKARLAAAGLRYFPQLMKTAGGVFPYPPEDEALIEELTGGSHDPWVANRAPCYAGLHCEAGAWYFVLDQHGDAWTCRTGKRLAAGLQPLLESVGSYLPGNQEESCAGGPAGARAGAVRDRQGDAEEGDEGAATAALGSLADGTFRRRARGGPCPYPRCPCTVPVHRGIVRRRDSGAGTEGLR